MNKKEKKSVDALKNGKEKVSGFIGEFKKFIQRWGQNNRLMRI